MAAEKPKKRQLKKAETVRDKATAPVEQPKKRRLRATADSVKQPLKTAREAGRREYHPIKLPDNRLGRFLTKSRRFTPRFFREAWAELRQVTWPNRSETFRLTTAVIVFALAFGGLIAAVDYGLEKLFREVLLP